MTTTVGHPLWRAFSAGDIYALAAKAASIGTGAMSLVMASMLVSPTLLGYYYGFLTIATWRTAIDGGMSYLIVRFAAHEWGLMADERRREHAEARLASLVRLITPVYFALAILFALGTYAVGSLMFKSGTLQPSEWHVPLIMLSVVMFLNMLALPLRALVEGITDIVASSRGTLFSGIAGACGCWIMLLLHRPLYAVQTWFLITAVLSSAIWFSALRPLWQVCRRASAVASISWRQEFWPLQSRLTLSMVAGLAMYQAFVPVCFSILGPVSAGRIGIAIQVQQAIDQLGSVWIQARTPAMAILSATQQFGALRRLAFRTLIHSLASAALTAAGVFGAILLLQPYFGSVFQKLPGVFTLICFAVTSVVLQFAHVDVAVVRCQKQEPFVLLIVITGGLTLILSIVGARAFGEAGIAVAFLACSALLLVPFTRYIANRVTPRENL